MLLGALFHGFLTGMKAWCYTALVGGRYLGLSQPCEEEENRFVFSPVGQLEKSEGERVMGLFLKFTSFIIEIYKKSHQSFYNVINSSTNIADKVMDRE